MPIPVCFMVVPTTTADSLLERNQFRLAIHQGMARPANSSFKVSYANSDTSKFGQGMSLAQTLQGETSGSTKFDFYRQPAFWQNGQNQLSKRKLLGLWNIAHHKK